MRTRLPEPAATALRQLSRSTRSSIRRVRESRAAQRLKRRVFEMPASMVPGVVAALEQGGIEPWLIGGWGVDALLGRQTRRHLDVDLAFDASGGAEQRAIAALGRSGFEVVKRETLTAAEDVPFRMTARIVMADRRRHLVDLHPVTFAATEGAPGVTVAGQVGGRQVRCLTAPLQLALHEGYEPREFDRADVARLREQLAAAGDS